MCNANRRFKKFALPCSDAPWCGHCKALAPEYVKVAQALKDEGSNIRVAKVDATVETELAEKFKVKGFPTIKFLRGEKVIDYSAGRLATDFLNWLKKKTGPPAQTLNTLAELSAFKEGQELVLVGLFKVGPGLQIFANFLLHFESFLFIFFIFCKGIFDDWRFFISPL